MTGWQSWDAHQQEVRSEQQGAQTQQSEADAIQTDLEANLAYDTKMHARLYALMQKFEQSGKADGMPRIMSRLADQLNRSCGLLAADNPLDQRCLLDYAALRAAATEPSDWRKSMLAYASATPQPLLSVGTWFGSPRSGRPTQVASGTPTPNPPEAVATPPVVAAAPPPPPPPPPEALPSPNPTAHAGHPGGAAAKASAPPARWTTEVASAPSLPSPESRAPLNPAASAERPVNTAVEETAPPAGAGTAVAGTDVSQACGAAASATPGPFVVYIQIYDDSQRAMASRLMAQFGTFGLNTPGIENVTNTARRTGHRQPASWPRPVLLYNASNDQAQTCAHALAGWLGNQPGFLRMPPTPLPLPTRLHGDPKVIEFWIPASSR